MKAQQPVTTQDVLWDQLAVLDHDTEEARLVRERRGFLGPEHAAKLAELRKIQADLAEEMTREETDVGLEAYEEYWSATDPDELYKHLYDDRHFDLLNAHVEKTAAKIDEIAAVIDANELNQEANQQNNKP